MAEGFARKIKSKGIEVFSAGIDPKGIHPMALRVMQEANIDISVQKSKDLSKIPANEIDIVITLCGNAAKRCPVFPGVVQRLHWAIEDPAKAEGEEQDIINIFRNVRDTIKFCVKEFFKSLETWDS